MCHFSTTSILCTWTNPTNDSHMPYLVQSHLTLAYLCLHEEVHVLQPTLDVHELQIDGFGWLCFKLCACVVSVTYYSNSGSHDFMLGALLCCVVVSWWWWYVGVVGGVEEVWCRADMCDPFLAAPGVAVSLPFMINPPSMTSWIVCRRKDRGGCSYRWLWCFSFCLFGGRPPPPGHCAYSVGGGGGGVDLRRDRGFFGLEVSVRTVCG